MTIILALAASPAAAEQVCMDRVRLVAALAVEYAEVRQSIGLSAGAMVETFANPDTGTWTVIVTPPTMVSCIVAAGTAYEAVSEPPGDPA